MHFLNKVHPFVNYAVFGTLLGTLLVIFLSRWLYSNNPKAKASLLMLPLVIPYLTYVLAMLFSFNSRCTLYGMQMSAGLLSKLSVELCRLSTLVGNYLTPFFLVSAALAILKLLTSTLTMRRYRNQFGYATQHEYGELLRTVEELSQRLNIRSPQVIVTSFNFGQAFTTGFLHPEIVISQGILSAVDSEELEAILAHELAHVSRLDSLTNWLSVFLRDVIFFVPVSYWVYQQHTNYKELAVDELTVRLTEKPLAYAQALIKVWRLSSHSFWYKLGIDNWSPNPSLVKGRGILEHRIQCIVDGPRANVGCNDGPPVSVVMLMVTVVSVSGLFFIC